jgi:hypothetical protein
LNAGQHAQCGGHALAALATQEHAEHMPQKGGEAGQGRCAGIKTEPACSGHRQPALGAVADQGEQGSRLVAAAQDVGGARVARAVLARVGQSEQAAGNDGKGHRAEQVGADDQ